MIMLKRVKLNLRTVIKKACALTVSVYALLGFLAAFVSLEQLLDSWCITELWCKLLVSALILLGVFLVCFVIAEFVVLCKREVTVLETPNSHSVFVVYGDLFSEKIVPSGTGRRNICFAVNRCFDTLVDDKLISSKTIHGTAFRGLYERGTYNPVSLDAAIQSSIVHEAKFDMLTATEKPLGNLRRYEVGTGADLAVSDSLHYFLIGIGKMDSNLKNSAENGDYCLAIQKMIEFFDTYSQGYPVLLPIIGAGLTRLGQNPKDLLNYLIYSLYINKSQINSDIYIVLRDQDRESIAIADLKS